MFNKDFESSNDNEETLLKKNYIRRNLVSGLGIFFVRLHLRICCSVNSSHFSKHFLLAFPKRINKTLYCELNKYSELKDSSRKKS